MSISPIGKFLGVRAIFPPFARMLVAAADMVLFLRLITALSALKAGLFSFWSKPLSCWNFLFCLDVHSSHSVFAALVVIPATLFQGGTYYDLTIVYSSVSSPDICNCSRRSCRAVTFLFRRCISFCVLLYTSSP